jgi:PAS domain S-box-containing protein
VKTEKAESNRNGDLRRQAEERLKDGGSDPASSTKEEGRDAQALVHELQVHQIELEMQNEELKRAKLEAEDALVKYSDLYDFAPIGLFTLDAKGLIQEVNLAGAALLGVERRYLLHKHFWWFVAPKDQPSFRDFCKKAFGTFVKQTCELNLIRDKVPAVYVRIEGTVIEDCLQNERLCRIAVLDITERKKAEEELARLASFPKLNPNSIVEVDLEGVVYFLNPAAEQLSPDLQEMGCDHPWLADWGSVARVFREGKTGTYVRDVSIGDKWYQQAMYFMPDSRRVRIYSLDITERKQAETALHKAKDELELRVQERTEIQAAKENLEDINEELRIEIDEHEKTEKELLRAKDEAEAAVKAKSLFLANMSHELRTPMNAVIGFTGLLLDEPLTLEQKDYLVSIRNSGNALLALISDLLDFSRMERENVEIEDQPFDLRSCIEEALDLVAGDASKKNLDLAYSIEKDMPEAVTGDPARLRQVLVNLLSNAVKYTDEGEAVLSVSSIGQDEILFEIRDTGIGIPEEKMNILFQPFSRVDESFSSRSEGAGLGLAISKKLIEMMGGRIWLNLLRGQGSTFTIKAKAVPGQPKAIPTGIQPKLDGKNVLIVDDNKTNRIILGKQLNSWGIIPVPKPSGQEALASIRGGAPFDAAILDMNMPDMDGVALAKEIRKYRKDLPLILLSSAGQRGKPELFEASLNKPIKPAQLHKVLSDTLAAQQSREETESLVADAQANHSPMRILLAEDNVSNQRVTLQMLKKLGYRADAVANGAEAVQALERQPYDLILMDIKMPVLGGIEATRMIRERWPDNGPKIIAITAMLLPVIRRSVSLLAWMIICKACSERGSGRGAEQVSIFPDRP